MIRLIELGILPPETATRHLLGHDCATWRAGRARIGLAWPSQAPDRRVGKRLRFALGHELFGREVKVADLTRKLLKELPTVVTSHRNRRYGRNKAGG